MFIIPMVLVNSSIGIGTGFSAYPVVRSSDVLDNARRYALSEELQPMTPKYRGSKGAITAIPDDNGNVQKWSSGIKRRVTKAIEIIELPVGTDGRLQDVPGGRSR
jgi:DNA topoisomerase-2